MKTDQIPCSCHVCGEGHMAQQSVWDAVEYKGQHGKICHYFSVCDTCGSEVADAAQTLENKREWVKFRKQIDKVPLGHEIAKMRQHYGLTQALAGQLFGGGPVAFSKYEHDDFLPDEAMANLLHLAIHYPDTVSRLALRKNISLPYSRAVLHVSLDMEDFVSVFKMDANPTEGHEHIHGRVYGRKKILPSVKSSTTLESNFEKGGQTWSLQ